MTDKKFLIALVIFSFLFANSASAALLSTGDLIKPNSQFYFLQTWKESIQTFFTFGAENKAKQYLHLAEVRLNEYQNMLEQGKTEIAEKTLAKYEKQLNNALQKTEELKNKGQDIKDLSQKMEEIVVKHLEVLQNNLEKAPEQAKKGLENAIENSQKAKEKILPGEKTCKNLCGDGTCEEIVCMAIGCPCPETKVTCPQDCTGKNQKSKVETPVDETANWKTYKNEQYGFEMKYPSDWETKIFNVGGKYLFGVGFKPRNLTGETLANIFVSKEKLGLLAVQSEKQNNGLLFTLQNSGGSDYLNLEKKILSTFKFIK